MILLNEIMWKKKIINQQMFLFLITQSLFQLIGVTHWQIEIWNCSLFLFSLPDCSMADEYVVDFKRTRLIPEPMLYACRYCHQKYTTLTSLRRHMKFSCRFNTTAIHFKCPYCNHASRRKDNLKTHIKTHSKAQKRTNGRYNKYYL